MRGVVIARVLETVLNLLDQDRHREFTVLFCNIKFF